MAQLDEDRGAEKYREPADVKDNHPQTSSFGFFHVTIWKDYSQTGTCYKHAQPDSIHGVDCNTEH
jgi:hypothetical protein